MPRLKPLPPAPVAATPAIKRVLVSVEEAAQALGMGRTTAFALIRDGQLLTVKIGKRRLVAVSELDAFVLRRQKGA